MTKKPVVEVGITDIDGVFVEPTIQGGIRILMSTNQAEELAIILPPAVLAKLEAKLEAAREHQAKASGRQ